MLIQLTFPPRSIRPHQVSCFQSYPWIAVHQRIANWSDCLRVRNRTGSQHADSTYANQGVRISDATEDLSPISDIDRRDVVTLHSKRSGLISEHRRNLLFHVHPGDARSKHTSCRCVGSIQRIILKNPSHFLQCIIAKPRKDLEKQIEVKIGGSVIGCHFGQRRNSISCNWAEDHQDTWSFRRKIIGFVDGPPQHSPDRLRKLDARQAMLPLRGPVSKPSKRVRGGICSYGTNCGGALAVLICAANCIPAPTVRQQHPLVQCLSLILRLAFARPNQSNAHPDQGAPQQHKN